jgi:hypothetical protein
MPKTSILSSKDMADGSWHFATSSQQGIWFLNKIPSLRASYLIPSVIEFIGPIDRDTLQCAVRTVLARHPALRSRFALDIKSRRVRYETQGSPPEVALVDAASEEWDEKELKAFIAELCYAPFDLAIDAPARSAIIATTRCTYLVLSVHHIVFDGWSREVFMDQVAEVYRATSEGRAADLPAPVHPAELADHVPESELVDRLDQALVRLRGAPTDIVLPYDRPRPTDSQSTLGGTLASHLDAELTRRLTALAAEEGCTLFMLAAALLVGTLGRNGEQRDFLIAFPWAGRDRPGSSAAVGMFVNTLLLRVDITDEPTWRELLRRSRRASLASYADADVPFDAIAAVLHPARDLTRPPLSPVIVDVVDELPRVPELGGETFGRYRPEDPFHFKFELALYARRDGEELELFFDYSADLFDAETVATFLAALERSATDLVNAPDSSVLNVEERTL